MNMCIMALISLPWSHFRDLVMCNIRVTVAMLDVLRSFGDRSYTVAAPKLWNELPKEIRDISSISVFKTCLKTHRFKLAFNQFSLY